MDRSRVQDSSETNRRTIKRPDTIAKYCRRYILEPESLIVFRSIENKVLDVLAKMWHSSDNYRMMMERSSDSYFLAKIWDLSQTCLVSIILLISRKMTNKVKTNPCVFRYFLIYLYACLKLLSSFELIPIFQMSILLVREDQNMFSKDSPNLLPKDSRNLLPKNLDNIKIIEVLIFKFCISIVFC